jgi:hypothetical protein
MGGASPGPSIPSKPSKKKKQQKMQASIDEEDRMLSEYEPKVKGEHQIAIGGD